MILCIFTLSLKNDLFAQRSTARFLLWKPSATSMSLGGSGASFYTNSFSSYYNPATLSEMDNFGFSSSYVKPSPFFDNIVQSYAALSFKVFDKGFLSFSGNLFWKREQVRVDQLGNILGGNKKYFFSWLGKITYAMDITHWFSIGASFGLLRYNYESPELRVVANNRSLITLSQDIGILFRNILQRTTIIASDIQIPDYIKKLSADKIYTGINIGIAMNNIGPKISMIDKQQADPMPTVLLLGTSYWLLSSNYLSIGLIGELENQVYDDPFVDYFRSGAELNLFNLLSLRGGYVKGMSDSRKSFPTFGAGLHLKFLSVNIARYNSTFIPTWHYDASLNLEF